MILDFQKKTGLANELVAVLITVLQDVVPHTALFRCHTCRMVKILAFLPLFVVIASLRPRKKALNFCQFT